MAIGKIADPNITGRELLKFRRMKISFRLEGSERKLQIIKQH